MRLDITNCLAIDDAESEITDIVSKGPGVQNVNKVAIVEQLRFDAFHSLPPSSKTNSISTPGRLAPEGRRDRADRA